MLGLVSLPVCAIHNRKLTMVRPLSPVIKRIGSCLILIKIPANLVGVIDQRSR